MLKKERKKKDFLTHLAAKSDLWKETNLLCRWIPKNLQILPPLGGGPYFPEVWVMQSDFQQVQNEKARRNRRATFQWENLTKHYHNQVIRLWLNINSDKPCWWYVRYKCDENGIFVVFLPKTHDASLIMRKLSDKSQLKDILENIWPVLLKLPT